MTYKKLIMDHKHRECYGFEIRSLLHLEEELANFNKHSCFIISDKLLYNFLIIHEIDVILVD